MYCKICGYNEIKEKYDWRYCPKCGREWIAESIEKLDLFNIVNMKKADDYYKQFKKHYSHIDQSMYNKDLYSVHNSLKDDIESNFNVEVLRYTHSDILSLYTEFGNLDLSDSSNLKKFINAINSTKNLKYFFQVYKKIDFYLYKNITFQTKNGENIIILEYLEYIDNENDVYVEGKDENGKDFIKTYKLNKNGGN